MFTIDLNKILSLSLSLSLSISLSPSLPLSPLSLSLARRSLTAYRMLICYCIAQNPTRDITVAPQVV